MKQPRPYQAGLLLALFLLLFLAPAAPALAQDLSLQVNFITGERERGAALDIGFVVANETNSAADSYQIEFFASRDAQADSDDRLLGTFRSDDGIPQNAFRENRIALDSCALAIGAWQIYGRIIEVMPGDSNRANNLDFASATLTLVRDTDFPSRCQLSQPELVNPGLNDAWFNPDTAGQGLLLTVFPDSRQLFAAWFTFETTRPAADATAVLGEPGHRWLTAAGDWQGSTAVLTVSNTFGGRFDATEPPVARNPAYGELSIEFFDCESALVRYELPAAGQAGSFPIVRVAPDNIALCETLAGTGETAAQ